ncbi:polysaccharide pyruvyl transferase family protein [Agarivorans sp.]|uniref:polysaccharide pyruvyl transferase family protein n=1 Tax=Agarivorans sp. TaxID=1872412 RepID=UPI003D02C255
MQLNPPLIAENKTHWLNLKDQVIDALSDHLTNKKVILVDYPIYLNIGDMLIHQGAERLFDAVGANIIGRFSQRNIKRLYQLEVSSDTVLALHGGGNFGDLYPAHQQLREKVIKRFKHNPIVILPQSVHFSSTEKIAEALKPYIQHPNITVFVRDLPSYDLLQQYMSKDKVKLSPDLATMLIGDLPWQQAKNKQTLQFRRKDIETTQGSVNQDSFDWIDLLSKKDQFIYQSLLKLARIENKFKLNLHLDKLWIKFSDSMIQKAVNHYLNYQSIDTDRLHGMILGLLMGLPVRMRDNSYRKLARYANCWLIEPALVKRA